ncbi:MAG: glycoside hydrolase family 78 protein [Planctomycetaceae bacterium]|nr:glycoside hydrolase family 78 protein [Planctomycetaceae bacterium]
MNKTILLACCFLSLAASGRAELSTQYLRCEYRVDPLGIDKAKPRLSWTLESAKRGQWQTAYQVLAASDASTLEVGKADLWDSGKVTSGNTTAVYYGGKTLVSNSTILWKVRVWDQDDVASDWSAPAKWSKGLLDPADWKARWIGYDIQEHPLPEPAVIRQAQWIWSQPNANLKAPVGTAYFRRTFELPEDWIIKKAECYYTADDFAQLFLNGKLIRSFRNKRVLYDISLADYLKPGRNILSIVAANEGNTESPAGLIAAIRIEADGGNFIEFTTDNQWRTSSTECPGWKTEVFDDSSWSQAAALGPLGTAPWQDTKAAKRLLPPARYLRKEFALDKPIKQAYLYTTALGIYQVAVNGQHVTDDYLSPGWTDYRKRVYYRTYDVTKSLQHGTNAMGATLADGWYAGYVGGGRTRNHYGRQIRLLSQLNVTYEDGSTQVIASGPDWKASLGPICYADLLQGEFYDAQKEMPGWSNAAFDDVQWSDVHVGSDEVHPAVQAAVSEPVTIFKTIHPVSVTEPVKGRCVFDMGQNFAGVVRIRVNGAKGQSLQLRHAERLNPDGTIYTTNLRTAAAVDTYICKGEEEEIWQPFFTFHGFQYVELTGLDYKPGPDAVTGLAMSSDTPDAGTFECSNPMVNKIQANAWWTQRMNFIDIPTDCPQRDERLGWTGDAQVYIQTACCHNDVQAFFTKWLIDLTDAQREDGQFPRYAPLRVKPSAGGPAWSDAGIICPWTIYRMYGDEQVLRTHYDAMRRYIEFNKKRCTSEMLPPEEFDCFGDWLSVNEDTPKDVIFTAYFAYTAKLMAQIAEALNKPDDAAAYNALFEQIKLSFNKAYVADDGRIKGDTQADYVLAIAYDLLDGQRQRQAADHLIRRIRECDNHLSTGFIGTKDLMLALAKIGRNDIAYQLLYNDTYPSWGFSIKNGATSIWERWNGWTPEDGFGDPGMNSFAHYSFGAVCQWMFENIGGIQPDSAGFKTILIRPQPNGKLTWAKTTYRSIAGPIVSNWKLENNRFILDVRIPPNTSATVFVPSAQTEMITESGVKASEAQGVSFIKQSGQYSLYKVNSGNYKFVAPWANGPAELQ